MQKFWNSDEGIMKVSQVIKNIWMHPMSIRAGRCKPMYRFLKWQVLEKPFHKDTGLEKEWFGGRKLMLYPGRAAATGNYYLGLMEYEEMAFCLAYATREDFFVDCGANVGIYSVLLGAECKGGIALEPGSDTFSLLEENLRINRLPNVQAIKSGAGAETERMFLTRGKDTTNHVIGQNRKELLPDACEEIEVIPLDSLASVGRGVAILKIDVEGMEKSVLKGAHGLLLSDELNVVILETFGSGELHEIMMEYGFQLCAYHPEKRELVVSGENHASNNGIYVKNIEFARERLRKEKRFEILGVPI